MATSQQEDQTDATTPSPPRELSWGRDLMIAQVVEDAKRHFGDSVDAEFLEQYARDVVERLWADSIKLTQFIPLLALGEIRAAVLRQSMPAAPAEEAVSAETEAQRDDQ